MNQFTLSRYTRPSIATISKSSNYSILNQEKFKVTKSTHKIWFYTNIKNKLNKFIKLHVAYQFCYLGFNSKHIGKTDEMMCTIRRTWYRQRQFSFQPNLWLCELPIHKKKLVLHKQNFIRYVPTWWNFYPRKFKHYWFSYELDCVIGKKGVVHKL